MVSSQVLTVVVGLLLNCRLWVCYLLQLVSRKEWQEVTRIICQRSKVKQDRWHTAPFYPKDRCKPRVQNSTNTNTGPIHERERERDAAMPNYTKNSKRKRERATYYKINSKRQKIYTSYIMFMNLFKIMWIHNGYFFAYVPYYIFEYGAQLYLRPGGPQCPLCPCVSALKWLIWVTEQPKGPHSGFPRPKLATVWREPEKKAPLQGWNFIPIH